MLDQRMVSIEELRDCLVKLPKEAWPYGRIVGLQENSLGRRTALTARNKEQAEQILKSLEIRITWWPSG